MADDYISQIRSLVKNSGIYALAAFLLPLVALVLAPFLTHAISRTDYGVLAVLNTAIALVAGITQFGLNNAFFRAYGYDYESHKDKLGVLSTAVILLLLTSLPITITTMLLAPSIATFLLNSPAYGNSVRLAALAVLLQNFTVPGLSWLRAESRATLYAVLSSVNLIVNLGATVVLVGILHMGIMGALLAIVGGYAVMMVCTFPVVLLRAGLRLRFDIARNLLSFGLPLVANFISIWFLQLSDRYLLGRLGSLAQTAIYTIAYSVGGILSVLILSPFSLAWPTVMFSIAKREDATEVFRRVFRWYSIFLLFATFGLLLVSTSALYLFFPPSYYAAQPVIPLVALSMLSFGIYSFFTVGMSIRRKPWLAVVLTTFAALMNIGLNIFLIPLYGAIGAAVSTLIAFAILPILAYVINQRIYPISFEVGLFLTALVAGVALYVGTNFLMQMQQVHSLSAYVTYLCALCLYGGFLFFLGKHPVGGGARATASLHINRYKRIAYLEDRFARNHFNDGR